MDELPDPDNYLKHQIGQQEKAIFQEVLPGVAEKSGKRNRYATGKSADFSKVSLEAVPDIL